jgi:hypothetical protein
MTRQPVKLIFILGGLLLLLGASQALAQTGRAAEITWPHPQATALYFVKNQGQLEQQVGYYLQGRDKTLNGDAFIAKVKADGTGLVYAGYIGGTGEDYGYGVAVDVNGNAYVTGYTESNDFPATQAPTIPATMVAGMLLWPKSKPTAPGWFTLPTLATS